ncbi:hypothetical protein RJ639_029989 [Escallonia herrerae]|uniref:Uncharacterized protein n=1 Tax=Escallonia herrerae TaxID=1293975 RepID=A0AA88X7L6_9ASTE|nr:hypothetical protein RJ639_029989 [Escallonia herrerae]
MTDSTAASRLYSEALLLPCKFQQTPLKQQRSMGRLRAKRDYEDLRNARISENKARLESLGLRKTVSELRSFTSSPVSVKRKERKVDFTSLRRSGRLKGKAPECTSDHISLRRSHRLRGCFLGSPNGFPVDLLNHFTFQPSVDLFSPQALCVMFDCQWRTKGRGLLMHLGLG